MNTSNAVADAAHDEDALTREYNRAKSPEVVKRLDVMKAARAKVEAAGSVFLASAESAMGARWETANKLKAARASAEQAFVLKAR